MKPFVLDCSVTMAWCFEGESDAHADSVLHHLGLSQALVPSIWPLEVANVLLVGERRGRLTEADSAHFITLLKALPITVDEQTARRAQVEILALGREQGLSSYDAAYLELAMREGCPLATLDTRLQGVAEKLGLPILDGQ